MAGGQLNTLNRLDKYLSPFCKELAINSFIASNFNYCPLIWHFSSANSSNMIEGIQKRAFRFLNKEHINNPNLCTMQVKRLRTLAIEIFKTLNNLNPFYMKEIFQKSIYRISERLKFNLKGQRFNQVEYGRNSLRVLGPILWNYFPNDFKTCDSLYKFKKLIKTWGVKNCPHYARFMSYITAVI